MPAEKLTIDVDAANRGCPGFIPNSVPETPPPKVGYKAPPPTPQKPQNPPKTPAHFTFAPTSPDSTISDVSEEQELFRYRKRANAVCDDRFRPSPPNLRSAEIVINSKEVIKDRVSNIEFDPNGYGGFMFLFLICVTPFNFVLAAAFTLMVFIFTKVYMANAELVRTEMRVPGYVIIAQE